MSDHPYAKSGATPDFAATSSDGPTPLHYAIDTLSAALIHAQALERVFNEGAPLTGAQHESLQLILRHMRTVGEVLVSLQQPQPS